MLQALLGLLVASAASADEPAVLSDGPDPGCVTAVHLALEPGRAADPDPERAPEPQPERRTEPRTERQADRGPEARPAPEPPPSVELPAGRAIGRLGARRCHALLRSASVRFAAVPREEAAGVAIPIRLEGPIGGVRVASRDGSAVHEIMDCRLAVALLAWAPTLREAGVRAALHYSTYRPGARVAGTSRVSGHARGLAIDLSEVELGDETLDVLNGWEARQRGRAPCHGELDESPSSAKLRGLVCDAVRADLFQVVLTPHYDRAHANHVHLELVPDVTWSYVH